MSSYRQHVIACDHPDCDAECRGGINDQVPSQIRPRLARLDWFSRKRPPTKSQAAIGIYPTDYQDFCPQHAEQYRSEPT